MSNFITQEFLYQVQECGLRQLDSRSIAILLELTPLQTRVFMQEFDNLDSEVRRYWEKGKLNKQQEIDGALENLVLSGEEGSGDAARALGYLQRKRQVDALKLDLFGV